MDNKDQIDFKGLREVDQKDLRVGDRIIPIPRLLEGVEEVVKASDADGDVDTGGDYYDPKQYRFLLVHREVPPLPTEAGSVITVYSNSGSGRWMLTEPANDLEDVKPDRIWVSAAGVSYTPQEMARFLESRDDRTFEVEL